MRLFKCVSNTREGNGKLNTDVHIGLRLCTFTFVHWPFIRANDTNSLTAFGHKHLYFRFKYHFDRSATQPKFDPQEFELKTS